MKNDKWRLFFKFLFGINLYFYQLKIVRAILEDKAKRLIILATTRAGKSYAVAMTTIAYALLNPNKKVFIIAPTYKQASVIMGYIYDFIVNKDYVFSQTILTIDKRELKLGKKMTLDTVTFKNGTVINILSAEGKGERLLGFGGDLVVVDESSLIEDNVFKTKIMRMLGESPDSQLIEIGNPIKNNHFYEHYLDEKFKKIKIDWRDCVKVGRLTEEFIDEQRKILTEKDFRTLYEAEFVAEEGMFFRREEIFNNIDECELELDEIKDSIVYIGIDFGRKKDYTSIAIIEKRGNLVYLRKLMTIKDMSLPEQRMYLEQLFTTINNNSNNWEARLDMTGLGLGITEELQRKFGKVKVKGINFAGRLYSKVWKANLQKVRVVDRIAYNLKQLFAEGNLKIPNYKELVDELLNVDDELKLEGYHDGHFDRFISLGLACLPSRFEIKGQSDGIKTNVRQFVPTKLKEVDVDWGE